MAKRTIYDFIRDWFDFSFENPDKVSPTHSAMYCWFVELNNRMGWTEKFGSPASQTMDAIGLKSYNTYKKIFSQLVEWEFIILVSPSKNQYQACIIALSKIEKAQYKALDKALILPYQNMTKQRGSTVQSTVQSTGESTVQSTDSIIIQDTTIPIDKILVTESALSNFDNAKKPFISPNRGDHCPTWEAVYECFFRMGQPDKALKFFEYYEGLGWKKGISPIVNFASFANTWLANPLNQAEPAQPAGRKAEMEYFMGGTVVWPEEQYLQYCNNPAAGGYTFVRYVD